MSTWVKLRGEVKDLEKEVNLMRVVLAQKEAHLESLSRILEEHREAPARQPKVTGPVLSSDEPGEWLSVPRNIQAQIIPGTLDEKVMRFLDEHQDRAWSFKDIASEISEDPAEVSPIMSRLYILGMVQRRKERGQDGVRVFHYRTRNEVEPEAPTPRGALADDAY